MNLVGANGNAQAAGQEQLTGTVNYLQGADPTSWITDVPTYSRVALPDVYPGVDLSYYSNPQQNNQLEYDFTVQPGVDPGVIQLAFQGANSVSVDSQGNLDLNTSSGTLVEHAPVLYQIVNGSQQTVAGQYVVEDNGNVGFQPGPYDASLPLVIDPILSFASYLGGNGYEQGLAIAVDSSGNSYLTGSTTSKNLRRKGAYESSPWGGRDVSVPKADP